MTYRHSLKRHLRTHDGFVCPHCGCVFKEVGPLNDHVATHEVKSTEYKCKICGKEFISTVNLGKHLKNHIYSKSEKENNAVAEKSVKYKFVIKLRNGQEIKIKENEANNPETDCGIKIASVESLNKQTIENRVVSEKNKSILTEKETENKDSHKTTVNNKTTPKIYQLRERKQIGAESSKEDEGSDGKLYISFYSGSDSDEFVPSDCDKSDTSSDEYSENGNLSKSNGKHFEEADFSKSNDKQLKNADLSNSNDKQSQGDNLTQSDDDLLKEDELFKISRDKNMDIYTTLVEEIFERIPFPETNLIEAKIFRKVHDTLYICNICSKKLTLERNLKGHYYTMHLQDDRYRCKVCQISFKSSSSLPYHLAIHKPKQFSCVDCSQKHNTVRGADECYAHHTNDKVSKCKLCKRVFPRKHMLAFHMRKFHSSHSPVPCVRCGKIFDNLVKLRNHQYTHARTHKCERCNAILPTRQSLIHHLRNHDGHVCPHCGKWFKEVTPYNDHVSTHEDKSPDYNCKICGIQFTAIDEAEKHHNTHIFPPKMI